MPKQRVLLSGNEAMGEAAIRAGCAAYFGYPITPQNELFGYMAKNMILQNRVFIQAESELAAIIMVFGAAATGKMAMTSSSSPGMSLMQEGISYLCGADLPCVLVNVSRAGPGLGGLGPAQGDYFQATRGGGHGDYHHLVFAPNSAQEAADITFESFNLAEKYRMPAMILADGLIGQMLEPVILPEPGSVSTLPRTWGVGNSKDREPRHITSLHLEIAELEGSIKERYNRYATIQQSECRFECTMTEDADLILVAFGSTSRVCQGVVDTAQALGIKIGLFRPISIWPFPEKALQQQCKNSPAFLVVEMNMGQLFQDVKMAINGRSGVYFYGRCGGAIPNEDEILKEATRILGNKK